MADPKGRRILVVEDDRESADLLLDNLAALGYEQISLGADAIQGTTLAVQQLPDLVILDCMMPAGGGPSVFARMRTNIKTRRIPVLFITAVPEADLRAKVQMDQRTFYAQKPVRLETLRDALARIFGQATPGAAPGTPA